MSRVELSKRLKSIADMVLPGTTVFDVGCDHGFLSIYLLENQIAEAGVALDVVEGPLKAAKEHVSEAGLKDRIECRLSDGLHNITVEELQGIRHKTLIIAGMGGPLILKILSECPDIRDLFDEMIVGPQSKIEEFRRGIKSQGLVGIDERMIFEDGKYYQIIKLKKSDMNDVFEPEQNENCEEHMLNRAFDKYGEILMERKNPVLKDFLNYEYNIMLQVSDSLDKEAHADRYKQVNEDMKINRFAFEQITKA